jgi:ketosteroid isomerase-like protein
MSEENVERVREAYAAFNRGDVEAAVAVFDEEAEWYPYLGALEGSVYRGREALRQMWTELNESFSGKLEIEVKELIDCGERIVAVIEARAVGSASGAEVRQAWAQLAALRNGLVIRVEPYPDKAAALEAAAATR